MSKIAVLLLALIFLCITITTLALPIVGSATSSQGPSTLPVNSFDVTFHSAYAQGVYAGELFPLAIFGIDASGTYTGFYGTIYLSLENGTITPSTITRVNGSWIGRVSVTGTNLAVITVHDSQGHTGKSAPLNIYEATPTPTIALPTPTPSVPEFSLLAILPLLFSMLFIAVILRYRNPISQNKPNV